MAVRSGSRSKLWAIPVAVVPLVAVAFLCFFYSPWFRKYRKGV
jgi:hypothetical protein